MLSAVPGMEAALGIYWLNAVVTQTKYKVGRGGVMLLKS